MPTPIRVLIVEDSEDDCQLLLHQLRKGDFDPSFERVDSEDAMRSALTRQPWDVIICDFSMPQFNALAALSLLRECGSSVPAIVVSGKLGEEIAVEVMKAGAKDYVVKDRLIRVVPAVRRELREHENRKKSQAMEEALKQSTEDRLRSKEALRRSEEQIQQLQKMDAIGRLAGGIAHDFNNMLAAIDMCCDLALDEAQEGSELRANIQEIKRVSNRGASLTRQLLLFSRKQVPQFKTINLNNVINQVEEMLKRLIGENIELSTQLDPGLGFVEADPGQMEQVLLNLVVNARDAMPSGGSITIETRIVDIDEDFSDGHLGLKPGRHAMLTVTDTGTGIDSAIQNKIFDPFFTTKPIGRGTGLGLSTVYGIIRQGNGSIGVYSEPGRGTVFKVYLPIVQEVIEEPNAVVPAPTPSSVSGMETILLVEDEERLRSLFSLILRKAGYQVLSAEDGEEAMEIFSKHKGSIHILITDVIMPKMGGVELARQFKQAKESGAVLYMSGYADDRYSDLDLRSIDRAHFIEKPFSSFALLAKVREVLDARSGGDT